MPRIPGNIQRSPVRSTGRVVQIDSGGDAIGQSLVGVQNDLDRAEQEQRQKRNRLELAKAKSERIRGGADIQASIDDDDYQTYESRYSEAATKLDNDILSKISDPEAKALYEQELLALRSRESERLRVRATAKERDVERASLNQLIDSNREMALTVDPEERMSFIDNTTEAIEAAKENGFISAVEAQNIRQKTTRDYAQSIIEGLSPEQRIAELNKGELSSFIPADVRDAMELQANVEIKRKASELTLEEKRTISNLKIAAKNGLRPLSEITSDVESLFNAGKISEAERTSILNASISKQMAAAKQADDFSAIARRLAGDKMQVVDPKQIDKFYEERLLPNVDEGELGLLQKADYVDKMKVLPKALKDEISTFLRSEDVDLIAQAGTMIDLIDNIPGVMDQFKSFERAYANEIVKLLANMEPREAARLASQLVDPSNEQQVKARESVIRKEKWPEDYESEVVSSLSRLFVNDRFPGPNRHSLTQEYKHQFESHYKASGDEEFAREKALQLINRDWARSETFKQTMKHPPEKYYPAINGSHDYIAKQLVRDLNDKLALSESISDDDIIIYADEHTERTVSSGEPEYKVMIVKDGISGLNITWKPSVEGEQKRVMESNKEIIDSRSSLQDDQQQVPDVPF